MFHKQNSRQPAAAALLALLLALTSAFSCIGLSGWASFRRQLAALDAQYTTVAYLFNPERDYLKKVEEWMDDGSVRYDDGTIWASPERTRKLAENAPGLLNWNSNILAAAHTPDQKGFSSGAADPLHYSNVYDLHRYSMSVMAVRCLAVEENPYSAGADYYFRFEWVEPVCRMDAYDLPEPGKVFDLYFIYNMVMDEAGTPLIPFEAGKTYLLRGDFMDFEVMQWNRRVEATADEPEHIETYWYRYTADNWERLTGSDATTSRDAPTQRLDFLDPYVPLNRDDGRVDKDLIGHPYPLVPNFYLDSKVVEVKETEEEVWRERVSLVPEDSWPFWAEYEGDWRDFLNTEEGRMWRDEIIPCCETSHNSVPVLLTDNVEGLSQFCKEESALLEGRMITKDEYETGAAVCMVGADYALYNGLRVGDALTLDLYRPAYFTTSGSVHFIQPVGFNYTGCMPLVEENRLDVTRDYTIVGLYSTPVWLCDPDGHGFRGDTVLAPKASVPELADTEEDKLTPLLNTLVLKNGSIEEFEAYMAENGAANRFRYHDYGYSEVKDSIESMERSALRLAALGGAAFLLGAAVFLLAGFGRMSAPARGLRLLGANSRRVAREMLSALLPLTAAGVILGGILGGLLYGTVCEAVLSQALAPDWAGVAAVAGLQLLALSAAAAVWAAAMARRGLMRRKGE